MLFVKYFLEPEVVSNTLFKKNTNVMIMPTSKFVNRI